MPKNWCFQTVVLGKILESPLAYKEVKPVNLKGNQPWVFIGRTDAEAEFPILWPPNVKSQLIGKDLDAGKDWRQEEEGRTGDKMVGWHQQLNGHEFEQTSGDSQGQESLHAAVHGIVRPKIRSSFQGGKTAQPNKPAQQMQHARGFIDSCANGWLWSPGRQSTPNSKLGKLFIDKNNSISILHTGYKVIGYMFAKQSYWYKLRGLLFKLKAILLVQKRAFVQT